MAIQEALKKVVEGESLSGPEMEAAMRAIMTGQATPAQIGGFLVGLRMKGETVEEIAAAARVMRELAATVPVAAEDLVDTCGTGGDAAHTFNISTTAAFAVAGAGGKVAKHGNRSVSSSSGSADVLEAAGVKLDLSPEQVAACIQEVGVGFMFAPRHHGAMRHAIGPRREMGVRTLFNLLGPLTNPAGAPNQVIGVFSPVWLEPLAQVLKSLGSRHVLVVHGEEGLDELSIQGPSRVAELSQGEVRSYTVTPEAVGLERGRLERVSGVEESLAAMEGALANRPGPERDIAALNAGAALYALGLAGDLREGVAMALDAIASGAARRKLEELRAFTRSL